MYIIGTRSVYIEVVIQNFKIKYEISTLLFVFFFFLNSRRTINTLLIRDFFKETYKELYVCENFPRFKKNIGIFQKELQIV